ncbi:hypothetical protein NL676_021140 [Syzygium grande]|nr:hypothetical protein NL676_021140 [Syzygium grande]
MSNGGGTRPRGSPMTGNSRLTGILGVAHGARSRRDSLGRDRDDGSPGSPWCRLVTRPALEQRVSSGRPAKQSFPSCEPCLAWWARGSSVEQGPASSSRAWSRVVV